MNFKYTLESWFSYYKNSGLELWSFALYKVLRNSSLCSPLPTPPPPPPPKPPSKLPLYSLWYRQIHMKVRVRHLTQPGREKDEVALGVLKPTMTAMMSIRACSSLHSPHLCMWSRMRAGAMESPSFSPRLGQGPCLLVPHSHRLVFSLYLKWPLTCLPLPPIYKFLRVRAGT